jgi:putative transposase
VKGRKRQIITDTLGLLVCAFVHPANVSDKSAIYDLLRRILFTSRLARLVVDAGYDSPAVAARCTDWLGIDYEVVQRTGKGFQVQPRRWVVERTFAWFGKYRRLSKEYEQLPAVSEAFLYVASIHIMTRRLAKNSSF